MPLSCACTAYLPPPVQACEALAGSLRRPPAAGHRGMRCDLSQSEAPPACRPGSRAHMGRPGAQLREHGHQWRCARGSIMALPSWNSHHGAAIMKKPSWRCAKATERAAAHRRTSSWTRPSWWRARTTGRSRCCTSTTMPPPSSPAGGPPSASWRRRLVPLRAQLGRARRHARARRPPPLARADRGACSAGSSAATTRQGAWQPPGGCGPLAAP